MLGYLSGLKREFHHIKTNREDSQGYEPTMVILNQMKPGKSFIITLDAIWKYVDPKDNRDAEVADEIEFKRLFNRVRKDFAISQHVGGSVGERMKAQAISNAVACSFADGLFLTNRILKCTGYNLAKMIQMFELELTNQVAAQLLLFIQDGLDDLKNMPELPPEQEKVTGEITVWEGGQKIGSRDLSVKESDLIIEEGEA